MTKVTITIKDASPLGNLIADPLMRPHIGIVVKSDPPLPLRDGHIDPDAATPAQAAAYAMVEAIAGQAGVMEILTARDPAADYTPEERAAIVHVEERIREDGAHNVRGCPRYTRAMCPYRKTILALEEKGWTP